jgi:hypothetical protein
MNYDDYDFESILETLEPLYLIEGADGTRAFLLENRFPDELADQLITLLDEMYRKAMLDD